MPGKNWSFNSPDETPKKYGRTGRGQNWSKDRRPKGSPCSLCNGTKTIQKKRRFKQRDGSWSPNKIITIICPKCKGTGKKNA